MIGNINLHQIELETLMNSLSLLAKRKQEIRLQDAWIVEYLFAIRDAL